jgi:hypothetical protein
VIDPPEIIEAARSQPGMSSGDFNIFERVQLSMTAQNAALENENANLKERVRELEQRLQRYEQGHGA